MLKESYSVNVNEKDMNPQRKEPREIMNFNYGPLTVESNNVTYPLAIIFIPIISERSAKKQLSLSSGQKKKLALAAKALLKDYKEDSELTIFTAIDSEDFHA